MGLFSKLKQNFNHGGVDVSLQAPGRASMTDASLPIAVTIIAKDSAQTIKSVRVELLRQSHNQDFTNSPSVDQTPQSVEQSVARADDTNTFVLNPGESKIINLSLTINGMAALKENLPQGALHGMASVVQTLETASEAMDQNSYQYWVSATADVDGITLDPSARQQIILNKPGEFSASYGVKL